MNIDHYYMTARNFPYFNEFELNKIGIYENYFYSENTNKEIQKLSKDWLFEFNLFSHGFLTEEYLNLNRKRVNTLLELKNKLKDDNTNEIKQQILELGWNPEIEFNNNTRESMDMYWKNNIAKLNSFNESDIFSESQKESKDKIPIYVVLSYTNTGFGKIIKGVTKGQYTHAGLSLDTKFNKMYTFNASTNGFSLEDIKNYEKEWKDSIMCVYAVFVTKIQYETICNKIDEILLNMKDYSYGFLTALGAGLQKSIKIDHSLICSQFVDYILKSVNIDVTKKGSELVTPIDFFRSKSKKLHLVYKGMIRKYKASDILEKINKLQEKEPDSKIIQEAKELPIRFDDAGNLLIKNYKKIDFDHEYAKCHKLLKEYEKTSSLDSIKYELCKLWFMNNIIERKIYGSKITEPKKKELQNSRRKILSDFHYYLSFVLKQEKDFDFENFYEQTPFSDSEIKIDKSTIVLGVKLIKDIL